MATNKLHLGIGHVREVRQDQPDRVVVVLDVAVGESIEIDSSDAVKWPVTQALDIWATKRRD